MSRVVVAIHSREFLALLDRFFSGLMLWFLIISSISVLISGAFYSLYVIKSLAGIDIFPDAHLSDLIASLIG